ncbi:Cytochrome c [compost metagenome]|uniref:Quinol:cytochrome c oxidoreductase monoheme cytochrome subunit n=1 Tax=Pedobacter xixiisoli TaxID=1476464 RepID=A0A286AEX2_9SPHI|nr:cytochrome c [Pedobacter xixiisoli]SOD20442.1 quinol:cytochrome c oxidoreductase monoheme cytochrome subunit [Pedobacter xixiisoli]
MKGSILAMNKNRIVLGAFSLLASVAMLSACNDNKSTGLEYARNMYDPIAYNQDQPNKNFANGATSQTPPPNTNPVDYIRYEYPNTKEGYEASVALVNPLALTEKNLTEGKHFYTVFCAPCHGEKGDGQGHIVKLDKGISGVPAYHGADANSSRGGLMKDMPAGKVYHTIMYGLNAMGSHASQLSPEERWKVVMYVQQLQKIQ